jgi:hypothetical protein
MTQSCARDEAFLQRVAEGISGHGLRLPTLIILEAGRPLTLPAGQLMWLAEPLLCLLWPRERLRRIAQLLEDPGAVAQLISYLNEEECHG